MWGIQPQRQETERQERKGEGGEGDKEGEGSEAGVPDTGSVRLFSNWRPAFLSLKQEQGEADKGEFGGHRQEHQLTECLFPLGLDTPCSKATVGE